jgi:hypothetical protein
MSSLSATASVAEDHSLCGPECSLHQVVRSAPKQPQPKAYNTKWPYNKKWRMYDGWDEMAKRVSTAVPLKDGSILQVFPEKRWFAGLIAWRSTFPIAWETRIHLSSELAALYGGKREMAMAPLSVEDMVEDEEAPAYDQVGYYKIGAAGDYQEDEEAPAYDQVGYYKIGAAGDYQEDEEDADADADAESFAAICRTLDKMGYARPLTKVQMAIIRDTLQSSA